MRGVCGLIRVGWMSAALVMLAACPVLCQSGWAHQTHTGEGHSATRCMNTDDCVCQGAVLEQSEVCDIGNPLAWDLVPVAALRSEVFAGGRIPRWVDSVPDPPLGWVASFEIGQLRACLGRYLF
jgi:hypothetical protein